MFLVSAVALIVGLYYTTMCAIFGRWLEAFGNLCVVLTCLYALTSATIWL